ncbi:MAG TPA: hypothetical protein DCZ95_05285 [Verrucomicrobia bacterium]|nr:MAG: hypothetical protein A2X46_10415 [Lentisphaerae bacterium GWF2_57_35]HBA83491.1 hypothetical protein [Verrucomicrobiota bacterium]
MELIEQQKAPPASGRCWKPVVVLLLVLGLYLVAGVFDHSVWSPTEPAVAGVVWNMFTHGDLAVPRIHDFPYFEKPPLCYWISYGFCRAAGRLDDGLLRLPSALYGLLCLALVYWVGKRRYGPDASLATVLLAATGLSFYELSHRACSDMLATTFAFACLALFVRTLPRDAISCRRIWLYDLLFALVLAASFYAKNFYTYLIVLPPVGLFLVWRRQFLRLVVLGMLVTVFTALLIAPWVAALYRSGGMDYLRVVFLDNTIGRFFDLGDIHNPMVTPLNDAYIVEKEKSPFFYLEALANISLPWIFVYAAAIVALFRRRTTRDDYRFFLQLALIAIPAVLSLSSSRVLEYLMPVLFILFLTAGEYLAPWLSARRALPTWERRLLTLNAVLVGAVLATAPVASAVLTQRLSAALWTLPAALFLVFLFRRFRREPRDLVFGFLGFTAVMLLISLTYLMPYLDRQKSYRYFFDAIRSDAQTRELYTTFCDDRRLPLISYYLNQRVPIVSEKELTALAASGRRIGLILPLNLYERKREQLERIPHTIIENPDGKTAFIYVGVP